MIIGIIFLCEEIGEQVVYFLNGVVLRIVYNRVELSLRILLLLLYFYIIITILLLNLLLLLRLVSSGLAALQDFSARSIQSGILVTFLIFTFLNLGCILIVQMIIFLLDLLFLFF